MIRGPACLGSDEDSLPGLQTAAILLYIPVTLSLYAQREMKSQHSAASFKGY